MRKGWGSFLSCFGTAVSKKPPKPQGPQTIANSANVAVFIPVSAYGDAGDLQELLQTNLVWTQKERYMIVFCLFSISPENLPRSAVIGGEKNNLWIQTREPFSLFLAFKCFKIKTIKSTRDMAHA